MDYELNFITGFDGRQLLIEKYCGRGADGDIFCAVADKNPLGNILLSVVLRKDRLGKGQVSFE